MIVVPAAAFAMLLAAQPAETKHPLDAAPSKFVVSDGHKVHYKSIGSGDTALVFVHGWTCDLTFWRDQVGGFDGKMRMVFVDLPGHGQSDKPQVDYSMDRFAKAVDAVLADAGVKDAILAGHSMGTPVIRQYYRRFPNKTRGLIAVDGRLQSWGKSEEAEQLAKRIIGRVSGPEGPANRSQMIDTMLGEATTPALRKRIKDTMLASPEHVVVGAMKGMIDPSIWNDDPITVPLQSIVTKSPQWTAEYEAYVRKLAPHVDYRTMDGVGHFLMMEKPAEFNAIMGEFVGKVVRKK